MASGWLIICAKHCRKVGRNAQAKTQARGALRRVPCALLIGVRFLRSLPTISCPQIRVLRSISNQLLVGFRISPMQPLQLRSTSLNALKTGAGRSLCVSLRWEKLGDRNSTIFPTSMSCMSSVSLPLNKTGESRKPLKCLNVRPRWPTSSTQCVQVRPVKHLCGVWTQIFAQKGVTVRSCVPSTLSTAIGNGGLRTGSSRLFSKRVPARGTSAQVRNFYGLPLPSFGRRLRVTDLSMMSAVCACRWSVPFQKRIGIKNSNLASADCVISNFLFNSYSWSTAETMIAFAKDQP